MAELSSTSNEQHLKLLEKIKQLGAMLVANDPKFPDHLRAIHKTLIQYEELSHLLSEDELAVIVEGAQKKLGIILAQETKETTPKSGKGLKNVKAEDL